MIRIVVDEALAAELTRQESSVELCDGAGRVVGRFIPSAGEVARESPECPFSDEELDRRRREGSERPLAEILRDLRARP